MFWVAQVVIVSFVIIFILHNLYTFFKETLTIPKMKDMVKRPQQKYDTLFRELRMRNEESNGNAEKNRAYSNDANDANDANAANAANAAMKTELKRYLMELNAPQSQPPQSHVQSHPEPEPQSNANFIEIGSAYQ